MYISWYSFYQTAADFHAALKRVAEGKPVGIASAGPFVRVTSLLKKLTDSVEAGRGDLYGTQNL